MPRSNLTRNSARNVVAAMVLGTALSAGEARATTSTATPPRTVETISRYCQACWRNARLPADHWPDATQQVFVRLLERVAPARWDAVLADESAERIEFLRAIDTVKKRTQRTRRTQVLDDISAFNVDTDAHTDNRAAVEALAPQVLSDRQRRIFDLTFAGWAVPEIANELGTTVARVSDEKYKAIQRMKTALNA